MRLAPAVWAASLALVAAACGKSTSTDPTPATVTRITMTGTTPALGASSQFTATAIWSDGRGEDVTAQSAWTSSAPSVVRVTGGLVTALTPGDAVITAIFQETSGKASITIAPPDDSLTPFRRDYIESLFLGTGVLTPTDGIRGCTTSFGTWRGFPSGTVVELVISAAVPGAAATALVNAANQVNVSSAGRLSVRITTTSEADPIPTANQVTVTSHADPISLGCSFPQGCTRFTFVPGTALIASARAILASNQFTGAYVHDAIGHGVMGLCHVDGNLIGGAQLSLMSFGPGVFSNSLPFQLSSYDLSATRPVFSSLLSPGATRPDFQQAGLVNPVNGAQRQWRPSAGSAVTAQIESPRIR